MITQLKYKHGPQALGPSNKLTPADFRGAVPSSNFSTLPPRNGPHGGEERVTVVAWGGVHGQQWQDLLRRPDVNTEEGRLRSAGAS